MDSDATRFFELIGKLAAKNFRSEKTALRCLGKLTSALTAWICTCWMFVKSQVRRKNKDAPNLGHPGIWDIIMRSAN
jgi:hypothetical protein